MSETKESCGCVDGVCSVLPKSDCIELCETETEKNNFKNDSIPKKSVLKNSDVKNLTIKAAAKFDNGAVASVAFPDGKKIAVGFKKLKFWTLLPCKKSALWKVTLVVYAQ